MKYFFYPLSVLLIFLFFSTKSSAQLFAGMRVNGRVVTQGDTINVCKGSSLNYQSTSTGATTLNWKFKLGTPPTAVGFTQQSVVYNTNGIDSTILFISNNTTSDSLYVMIRVTDTKPVVNYSFNPNNECGNIPVVFSNSSTGSQNVYQWSFGMVAALLLLVQHTSF